MPVSENTIYCENCLDTMARMPDNFIDLTVTSPPYDNLRKYNGFEFDFESTAKELYRVTKKGGVVVWVVGDSTIDGSETLSSFKQAILFRHTGFNVHDTMIYHKTGLTFPESTRYYPSFEYMFVLSKHKPKKINLIADKKNSYKGQTLTGDKRQPNGEMKRISGHGSIIPENSVRQNVWSYGTGWMVSSPDEETFQHGAAFPEMLAADHIKSWSNEGDLVYDPFAGSGTTLKMAHLLNRKWIGSEISKEYCDLIEKRMKPYLMQQQLFI